MTPREVNSVGLPDGRLLGEAARAADHAADDKGWDMNLTMQKNGSDGLSLHRRAAAVNVRQAKQIAKAWVEANAQMWPGLRAAHLVGGITALPDDAPFPTAKDVDLHLIVDEESPALQRKGPGPNILEVAYGGLSIEAGIKSAAGYASPEAVLANPEIA